jgi:hypothetical protein
MAGEIGTPEYRRLDAEISRRRALASAPRQQAVGASPWRR